MLKLGNPALFQTIIFWEAGLCGLVVYVYRLTVTAHPQRWHARNWASQKANTCVFSSTKIWTGPMTWFWPRENSRSDAVWLLRQSHKPCTIVSTWGSYNACFAKASHYIRSLNLLRSLKYCKGWATKWESLWRERERERERERKRETSSQVQAVPSSPVQLAKYKSEKKTTFDIQHTWADTWL